MYGNASSFATRCSALTGCAFTTRLRAVFRVVEHHRFRPGAATSFGPVRCGEIIYNAYRFSRAVIERNARARGAFGRTFRQKKEWEIIADNLRNAGWTWAVSQLYRWPQDKSGSSVMAARR